VHKHTSCGHLFVYEFTPWRGGGVTRISSLQLCGRSRLEQAIYDNGNSAASSSARKDRKKTEWMDIYLVPWPANGMETSRMDPSNLQILRSSTIFSTTSTRAGDAVMVAQTETNFEVAGVAQRGKRACTHESDETEWSDAYLITGWKEIGEGDCRQHNSPASSNGMALDDPGLSCADLDSTSNLYDKCACSAGAMDPLLGGCLCFFEMGAQVQALPCMLCD